MVGGWRVKNSQEADFPLQEKQSQMEPDRVQQTLQMDRQEIQLAERDEWHFCRAEVTKVGPSHLESLGLGRCG